MVEIVWPPFCWWLFEILSLHENCYFLFKFHRLLVIMGSDNGLHHTVDKPLADKKPSSHYAK